MVKSMSRRPSRRERYVYGVQIRGKPCAYCGSPAVNGDHVIPRSLVRKYKRDDGPSIPAEWLEVVPSCFSCNILKGNRRLIPPYWRKHKARLDEFFGGVEWRVWFGDPHEEAYSKAWAK